MMINRHNYEEFLLMYVDNELNMHQRIELELFMEQNPDLASELEALQGAVLLPDETTGFPDKTSLLRKDESLTGPENREQQFLLYLDNELDAKARDGVDLFLQQHPQYMPEFQLLQQTVLSQEKIVFTHKEVLYRTERERRVIPVYLTRFAVAAAVLGITATTGWWFLRQGSTPDVIPENAVAAVSTPAADKPALPAVTETQATSSGTAQQSVVAENNSAVNSQVQVRTNQTDAPLATVGKKDHADNTTYQPLAANTSGDIISTPVNSDLGSTATVVPVTATASLPEKLTTPATGSAQTAAANTVKQADSHQEIAYKELDTSDEEPVYVGSLSLNRNKVKGFLKKAGRLLGGKAKAITEDDNL